MNTGANGNMIMTNSSMSTMAGMAGGGLVVSSSVNKALSNTTNMMAPGQGHHPTNHAVAQVRNIFVCIFLIFIYFNLALNVFMQEEYKFLFRITNFSIHDGTEFILLIL